MNLRTLLILPCILLLAAPWKARADERPNIVLRLADNWVWPHASVYGDPVVSTPHFDQLATEGNLFDHTYCPVPCCSPARAVLVTGQAAHRLGAAANLWGSWPHSLNTYPEILEDAGYAVAHQGKGWASGMVEMKSGASRNRNPAGPKVASFAAFLDRIPALTCSGPGEPPPLGPTSATCAITN